ncbi:MAG: CDP-alcohol phosphatidyltransferase family protein [Syntrophorhabdales bacterium]|jgi:phosphatidylglycerophosphate synthase
MVKAAFIVARGQNGLRPVFGVPAVRRLVLAARRLGLDGVHVLGRDRSLRQVLSDLIPADAIHLIADTSTIGAITDKVGLIKGDRVLVMRADHVIDRWSLQKLLEAGDRNEGAYWSYDGKGGEDPPGEPVYVVKSDQLVHLLGTMWSDAPSAFAAGAEMERVRIASGLPVLMGDGREGTRGAEASLLRALGVATAQTDSLMSRSIHRPISRFISRRLAKTPVTPNGVTLFTLIVGLAGAFFLGTGSYAMQVLGSLLFLASTILDGVDGEVARLTLRETVSGHYFDIVGDNVVHVAIFLGIALGLSRTAQDPVYLEALGFLLIGFGLCALTVHRLMGHGPEEQGSAEAPWLAGLLVNRDFAYLVVLLALAGRLDWFLFATTVGVYVFALVLFLFDIRRRGRRANA